MVTDTIVAGKPAVQRDPLPTLLTDIVKEPMPALDEMSGLEPAHLGIRNPQQRDLTKADIAGLASDNARVYFMRHQR